MLLTYQKKRYYLLLVRTCLLDNDGYHFFLVFPAMLDLLTLDNKKKASPKNIKPFDTNLA